MTRSESPWNPVTQANVGRQSLGGSVTSAPRVEPHTAPSPTTGQQRQNCAAHRAQIGRRSRVARFHQPADAGPFAGPCLAGRAWLPRGHVGSAQPGQHGAAARGALDGSHGHREAAARRTWDVSPSVEASPAHPGSNATQRRHHQPANSGRIAWHIALKLVVVRAWHAYTSQLTLGRSPGLGWPAWAPCATTGRPSMPPADRERLAWVPTCLARQSRYTASEWPVHSFSRRSGRAQIPGI